MKSVNQKIYSQPKPILNETTTRGLPMNDNNATMTCPHCDGHIDMTDLMRGQISKQFKTEHQEAFAAQSEKFEQQLKDQINQQRGQAQELAVKKAQEAKEQAQTEMSELVAALNIQLEESNRKVKDLYATTANIEKMKRDHSTQRAQYEADSEVEFSSKLREEAEKQRKALESQNETRLQQKMVEQEVDALRLRKQLQDQKNQTAVMTRKLEQGSQQLQGEAAELIIENWLKDEYEFDSITEIKPGQKGADVLQIIHTREIADCGSIYYESKNTKEFKKEWIPKLQRDMLANKSNVGIIVTRTMPSDMPRSGSRDGIWICSFEDFKAVVAIHRACIIQLKVQSMTQDNRNDKKDVLYDFVISQEYQVHVQNLVNTFIEMQSTLKKEQRTQASNWKEREKQIENIISSTTVMYGSIKGIAGNSVKRVSELELPSDEELELFEEDESSSHLISSTIN